MSGPFVTAWTLQSRLAEPPAGTSSRYCVRFGDQSSGSTYTLSSVVRMFRWATYPVRGWSPLFWTVEVNAIFSPGPTCRSLSSSSTTIAGLPLSLA